MSTTKLSLKQFLQKQDAHVREWGAPSQGPHLNYHYVEKFPHINPDIQSGEKNVALQQLQERMWQEAEDSKLAHKLHEYETSFIVPKRVSKARAQAHKSIKHANPWAGLPRNCK